jgi:hypothetical protein
MKGSEKAKKSLQLFYIFDFEVLAKIMIQHGIYLATIILVTYLFKMFQFGGRDLKSK